MSDIPIESVGPIFSSRIIEVESITLSIEPVGCTDPIRLVEVSLSTHGITISDMSCSRVKLLLAAGEICSRLCSGDFVHAPSNNIDIKISLMSIFILISIDEIAVTIKNMLKRNKMVDEVGFEPTTYRLSSECSTS